MSKHPTTRYIVESGVPILTKSVNLYPPGPHTSVFVWYPMGVMKDQEAPRRTVMMNGL